jgi:hypothetical protein
MTRLIDRGIFCVFCEEKRRAFGILFDEAGKVEMMLDSGGISVCMECFNDDAVLDRARALQGQQPQPVDTEIIDDIVSCDLCNRVADVSGVRVNRRSGELEICDGGEDEDLFMCDACFNEEGIEIEAKRRLERRGVYHSALRSPVRDKLDSKLLIRMTKEMREELDRIKQVVGGTINKVVVAMIAKGIEISNPRPPKKRIPRGRHAQKVV